MPFEPEVVAARVTAGLRAARLRANEALLRSLVSNITGAVQRCPCDEDRRGVTAAPGLYFLGLPWQHARAAATRAAPELRAG